jgi:hypothetical protein
MNITQRQIPLRVDDRLLARIEKARGEVPRERWIRRAIEMRLELESAGKARHGKAGKAK